jgi:DNA-binding NtrC family response regulator
MIAIPPLRDRGEDIITLARFFLGRSAQECGGKVKRFTSEAEQALVRYPWPGNVRELMHVMERIVSHSQWETIRAEELNLVAPAMQPAVEIRQRNRVVVEFGDRGIDLEDVERQLIAQALVRANWNRADAARLLGISKETLRYRVGKFNLTQSTALKEDGGPALTDFQSSSHLN